MKSNVLRPHKLNVTPNCDPGWEVFSEVKMAFLIVRVAKQYIRVNTVAEEVPELDSMFHFDDNDSR